MENNSILAYYVFCVKKMETCPAYVSKINSICEKQLILLMILYYDTKILLIILRFCGMVLRSQKDNVPKINQYMASDKVCVVLA